VGRALRFEVNQVNAAPPASLQKQVVEPFGIAKMARALSRSHVEPYTKIGLWLPLVYQGDDAGIVPSQGKERSG